jgi:hypothetical protein
MSDSSRTNEPQPRPLGVAHLIFGLIFSGIAAVWIIGKASNTDVPDLAVGVPIVLIGAGIIGLAVSVLNQRRTRARLAVTAYADEPGVEDTTLLTTENEDLS